MDHVSEASRNKSLRECLQNQDYATAEDLLEHIEQIKNVIARDWDTKPQAADTSVIQMIGTDTKSKAATLARLDTLYRRVQALVKSERSRAHSTSQETSDVAMNAVKESLPGFPDRRPESQALFTGSVGGPLFSSIGQLDPALIPAPNVHISKVLPSGPAEFRVLGDITQDPVNNECVDIMKSRRERLLAVKRPKHTKFESFGLSSDRTDAIVDDLDSLCNSRHTGGKKKHKEIESEASMEEQDKLEVPSTTGKDLSFSDELLGVFEGNSNSIDTYDVTASLLRLSSLQEMRLKISPFSSPSTEEQDLASRIATTLQDQILTADVVPKQVVHQGVRSNFTFPQLTASYYGTLPPTIAQATKATLFSTLPPPTQEPSSASDAIFLARRK